MWNPGIVQGSSKDIRNTQQVNGFEVDGHIPKTSSE